MTPPTPTQNFRPIPAALCERIARNVESLRVAESPAEQLAALFLAFAGLKDAERMTQETEEGQ